MQNTNVDYQALTEMLTGAAELICQHRDELGKLDAAIGDGDHGVTMERVMNIVLDKIKESETDSMSVLLDDIAWSMLDCDGGATGPLYGSLFLGMSDAVKNEDILDGAALAKMFEGGMQNLMQQTKAKLGDKTMMDALIPAVKAARETADEKKSIEEILLAAATAAQKGSDFTATIPAHYGRAKFQGDRTIGHPDPGSVSISLMFLGFKNGLKSE